MLCWTSRDAADAASGSRAAHEVLWFPPAANGPSARTTRHRCCCRLGAPGSSVLRPGVWSEHGPVVLFALGVWTRLFRTRPGPPQPLLKQRQHISKAGSLFTDSTLKEMALCVCVCAPVCACVGYTLAPMRTRGDGPAWSGSTQKQFNGLWLKEANGSESFVCTDTTMRQCSEW